MFAKQTSHLHGLRREALGADADDGPRTWGVRDLLVRHLPQWSLPPGAGASLMQRPRGDDLPGGRVGDRVGEVGPLLRDGDGDINLQVRERLALLEGGEQVDAAQAADVVAQQPAPAGEEWNAQLWEIPPANGGGSQ